MKKITNQNGRIRVQTINEEPTRTQQHYKDQCDVNNIIAKYKKTGVITHLARSQGVYADVSQITDYQTSLQKVMDAQNAFSTLPSELRLRFNNDPQQLLAFLQDPKNYDEGVTLGLYEQKTEPTPESITQNNDKKTKTKNDPTNEEKN